MNGDKKRTDMKFTPGSCLAGVALLVVAAVRLVQDGHGFSTEGYEGLQGFAQFFPGVLAMVAAGFMVFAVGAVLYQVVLAETLNKWKVTANPIVKSLLICLIASAILWMIR